METHRIPLESTRLAQEEERKRIEEEQAAILAAAEEERKKKRMIIPPSQGFRDSEWIKIKTRRKIAKKSRKRNR